jgi:hypothetical protein
MRHPSVQSRGGRERSILAPPNRRMGDSRDQGRRVAFGVHCDSPPNLRRGDNQDCGRHVVPGVHIVQAKAAMELHAPKINGDTSL